MFKNAKFIYENSLGDKIEFYTDSPFRIFMDGLNGLSSNNITVSEVSTVNNIGTTAQSQSLESKSITINGEFDGDIVNNRLQMINVIFPLDNGKFIYQNGETNLYLDVIPTQTPEISNDEANSQKFQFTLLVAYPFWKNSKGSTVIKFGTYLSNYRYPQSFSSTIPWKISSKLNESITNIYNDSNYPIGFKVTFVCNSNVQLPYILNVNTKELIAIETSRFNTDDTTGAQFEVTTIDNQKGLIAIEENGIPISWLSLLSFDSTFFKLARGDNQIKFGATTNASGLEVYIEFEPIVVGI